MVHGIGYQAGREKEELAMGPNNSAQLWSPTSIYQDKCKDKVNIERDAWDYKTM